MTVLAVVLADESKKSGPLGLVVILLLCIACYFLFKSMSRHMRRVREDFPRSAGGPGSPETPPTESAEPAEPADSPDSPRSVREE